MWKRRSHILSPLTELTKVPRGSKSFHWGEAQDKALSDIKNLISKNKDFWAKAWLTKRIKNPQIVFRNLY